MLVEEPPELGHHHGVDPGMPAALALPEALLLGVVAHAVETLGAVEVEVVPAYPGLEPQEALDPLELGHRVVDQLVAVNHQDLPPLEPLEPAVHVHVVDAYRYRPVRLVYTTVGSDHQLLEAALEPGDAVAGYRGCEVLDRAYGRRRVTAELGVVRYRPGHRLPDYQKESDARVHGVDSLRHLRYEINVSGFGVVRFCLLLESDCKMYV